MNLRLGYLNILGAVLVLRTVATAAYHYTGSQMFNDVNDGLSILMIGFSFAYLLVLNPLPISYMYFLVLAAAGIVATAAINFGAVSLIIVIKYASLYCFYAAGRAAGRSPDMRPIYLIALAILPLAFLPFGPSKVIDMRDVAHLNIPPFGFLPNANTATLYYSAIIFAFTLRFGYLAAIMQFPNALFFARNGAILATAIAFVWVDFKRISRKLIWYLPAAALIVVLAAWLGAFDRVARNMAIVVDGLATYGVAGIASMSYGDLAHQFQSTDLSAFFRLKHWLEIWEAFISGGPATLLFGYGPGQSPLKTTLPLVPHNDYLRILAEFGLFNFALFAAFMWHALKGCVDAGRVMFMVFALYFFTENLLDNATSMALFFTYAGVYRARVVEASRTMAATVALRASRPG